MQHSLNYRLRHVMERLCGTQARAPWCLALACAVLPASVWAQQPSVQDISGSSNGFYEQTETRSSGSLVLFNQVQEHQRELKQLQGQVEELRHELEKLRNQSQQRYLDLDSRLSRAASTGSANAGSGNVGSGSSGASGEDDVETNESENTEPENADTPEDSASASSSTTSAAAQEDYQAAFAHVQARDFDQAIDAFEQFVSEHPNTRLTPNGYYWLGELHASEDNLDAAEQAFTRVIDKYADSSKVPDALYKLGLVKARQGDAERSQALLEQVKDDYPQSTAAGLASDFLRQSAS
ncbi:MAG: tol-pal system protein YbgF [Halomonas sp.]|nr:tol-pal system protein YbgF [Halomonas sp.]MDN6297873.1 tol-pal system protein YbgF [Halomonas sp.]MDN6315584.1 tol-pal system protein YbgF [Halomonas sp.]MDN6336241.1 tol-pal system protein YbgF [Halomonas sp.]